VLSWIERAIDEGMREVEWMQELGIPLQRLLKWREEEQRIAV
jgi:hypothetical protein